MTIWQFYKMYKHLKSKYILYYRLYERTAVCVYVCRLSFRLTFANLLCGTNYFCRNTHYVLIFVAPLNFPFPLSVPIESNWRSGSKVKRRSVLTTPAAICGKLVEMRMRPGSPEFNLVLPKWAFQDILKTLPVREEIITRLSLKTSRRVI